MSLQISRDQNGNVTILDKKTGKSDTVATVVSNRPAERFLTPAEALPAHHWGRLA